MGAKKTFDLDLIKTYVEDGLSLEKIAKKVNASRPTIGKFLKENNLKTKRNLSNEFKNKTDIKNKVIKLYQDGLSLNEISKIYNVSVTPIKKILLQNNIALRSNSEAHQKYDLDIHYFDKIDTINKAYLLGFLCADGYVTKRHEIGIQVKSSDAAIIHFFQKELKTNKPLLIKENSIGLVVQNKNLYDQIIKYSIIPNKSLVLNIEEVIEKSNLSNEQIKAFLLGYFDGDGGIYKYKTKNYYQYSCSITGTLETCQYYKKYFSNVGFITKRNKDTSVNNYTYCIGGRKLVKTALSNIYSIIPQIDFFYNRKYNLFKELSSY